MYYLIPETLRGYTVFHLDAWNVFVFSPFLLAGRGVRCIVY